MSGKPTAQSIRETTFERFIEPLDPTRPVTTKPVKVRNVCELTGATAHQVCTALTAYIEFEIDYGVKCRASKPFKKSDTLEFTICYDRALNGKLDRALSELVARMTGVLKQEPGMRQLLVRLGRLIEQVDRKHTEDEEQARAGWRRRAQSEVD